MKKRGFVLIPGAGMSDWIWTKLTPLLQLDSISISKRIEHNTYQNRLHSEFEDIIAYVNQVIETSDFDEVIMVGHSGAGLIAGELGKRNSKVKHIVFLAANIPAHGGTSLDSFPEEIRNKNIEGVKLQAQADTIPMKALENQFRSYFCNMTEEEDVGFILEQNFQPEPICVLTHQVNWTEYPDIKKTYILCMRDKTISIEQQDRYASNLGITDIQRIDSDHMVMISHAKELSDILNKISEEL